MKQIHPGCGIPDLPEHESKMVELWTFLVFLLKGRMLAHSGKLDIALGRVTTNYI